MSKSSINVEIGKIIRFGRKSKGINQSQLANIMDVTPGTISHWETNNRSIYAHDLIKIANELDIVQDLFPGYVKKEQVEQKDREIHMAHEIAMEKLKIQELEKKLAKIENKLDTKNRPTQQQILVVEDDEMMPIVIKSTLMAEGYDCRVVSSSDGLDALNLISDPEFNTKLIVLDLLMPHISGLEFLRILKSNTRIAKIPIVILTAASSKTIKEASQYEPYAILKKPFNYTKFIKTIKDLGI